MRRRSPTRRSASPLGEQHHESLAADGTAALPSDRSVGFVFAAAATVMGLVPWLRGGSPRLWALAAAAGLLLITLTRPRWLHPLNRVWMAFGSVANIVVSSVLMAAIFFAVITPLALGAASDGPGSPPAQVRPWRGQLLAGASSGGTSARNHEEPVLRRTAWTPCVSS